MPHRELSEIVPRRRLSAERFSGRFHGRPGRVGGFPGNPGAVPLGSLSPPGKLTCAVAAFCSARKRGIYPQRSLLQPPCPADRLFFPSPNAGECRPSLWSGRSAGSEVDHVAFLFGDRLPLVRIRPVENLAVGPSLHRQLARCPLACPPGLRQFIRTGKASSLGRLLEKWLCATEILFRKGREIPLAVGSDLAGGFRCLLSLVLSQ